MTAKHRYALVFRCERASYKRSLKKSEAYQGGVGGGCGDGRGANLAAKHNVFEMLVADLLWRVH